MPQERSQTIPTDRLLLPASQALLGLQFAVLFSQPFAQLPDVSKLAHMTTLALVAMTVILLATPVVVHERSEDKTERFRSIAVRLFSLAAVPLALDIAIDSYVAGAGVLGSASAGLSSAFAVLVMLTTFWFGFPLWHHKSR